MHLARSGISFLWIGLICFIIAESAHVPGKVKKSSKEGCISRNALECVSHDGISVDVSGVQLSPLNSTCWFNESGNGAYIQRVCQRQGHTSVWVDTFGELHVRKERGFFHWISGAFRVIHTVTSVVKGIRTFVCSFFCHTHHSHKNTTPSPPSPARVVYILPPPTPPPPPPNTPPSLTCASLIGSSNIIARPGQQTAQVSWTAAYASDREDGRITVSQFPGNFVSGAEYSEGSYVVSFRAVDSKGLSQECSLAFRVIVLACNPLRWPDNGYLECPNAYTLGSQCSLICKDGYQIDPRFTSITCIKSSSMAIWSKQVSDCKPTPCATQPSIENGIIYCPQNLATFGITFTVTCNDGFKIRGSPFMACNKDGLWNAAPSCEDKTSPTFTSGTCPNDIQVNIDSSNNTAIVDWQVPIGTDNSDNPPTITERHGFAPGQRFTAGSHMISYGITDVKQNQGYPCSFFVQVQTISCQPPSLNVEGAEHMMYDCPDLYRYGAVCELACKSGYPLGGVNRIQCLNKGESDPPVLDWHWDDAGLKPFCKVTKCPDLKAPTNGALTCDLWVQGVMCQLQCQNGFDVPFTRDGMYVCGQSTGQWRPDSNVPDCNPKRSAHQMHLKSDVYYYTGRCNSSAANLMQIKSNFVNALIGSNYHEACVNVPECKADFVNVTCGPVIARRRRSANLHNLENRDGDRLAYTVTFDITIPFEKIHGKSNDVIFSDNEAILQDIIDKIQIDIDGGRFDIPNSDMHIERDSFGPGIPALQCPKGTIAKQSTASCLGCPVGRFFSEDIDDCVYCPIGTYQDSPYSIACKLCPLGTNTTDHGATDIENCLDLCTPGHFSPTGLSPCALCDSKSYQPNAAAVSCITCPSGKRTRREGATVKASCQDYDLEMDKTKSLKLKTQTNATSLTLSTWLLVQQTHDILIFFKVSSTSPGLNNLFVIEQDSHNLYINTTGYIFNLGTALSPFKWQHLAVTADASNKTLQVFWNGKSIYRNNSFSVMRSNLVDEMDEIFIKGNFQISSYSLMDRVVSDSEISKWASSCGATFTHTILTSDDIALSQSAKVMIPSKCDADDECESLPCGRHECINKQGAFQCICSGGYTGKRCETKPDYCIDNACMHGSTCVSGSDNYTCSCSYGYSGDLCEKEAVHGGWTVWTEWTMCSKICGGGNTVRTRKCENPTPDPEGQPCQGISSESKTCNADKCPECSRLLRSYGVIRSCSEIDHLINCTISCRPGLYFIEPPLPYYECGTVTGYKWNHQNDNNPRARLPACSEVKPPVQMDVLVIGQYTSVTCTNANTDSVLAALQPKLSPLECVKQNKCDVKLDSNKCTADTRARRSTSENKLTVAIKIQSTVKTDGSDFNLTSVIGNESAPSPSLLDFLEQTMALETTAQQIFNNSVDFFQVVIDGKHQSVAHGSAGVYVEASVKCPRGSVRLDVFCAECPAGSYSDGKEVHPCPKGRYQDQKGQTTCKPCPSGETTQGTRSLDITECEDNNVIGRDSSLNAVKIATGVCVSVASLALTGAAIIYVYKYFTKRKRQVNGSLYDMDNRIKTSTRPQVLSQARPYDRTGAMCPNKLMDKS